MANSYRGQFLVAAPQLRDPNFYKTVVLIAEHGEHGAMGLVVNRPSSVLVSHALSKHFDLGDTGELVFVGGPVEPLALFMLHSAEDLAENEQPIVPGLYIGNSGEVFEEVLQRGQGAMTDLKYRIYSGCAGWAPGQLEGEVSRGDWYLLPACRDMVYHDDPYMIYDTALGQVREAHRLLPHPCIDPQWN
jgi:putative transcriptional regulator